jgi:hypothetical protein
VVPTISPCASTMTPASVFPAAPSDDSRPPSLDAAAGARSEGGPETFVPRTAAEVLDHPAEHLPAAGPLAAVLALVVLAGSAGQIAVHRGRHG